ncbi:peptidylprolyl isomerase [Methanothermobacter wolfeii]|uniref:peptidylprolyl isomerase n=1 Tax=Methanothermobacter wolfeii TaxID=145261 RepID=UPI0024B39F0E|nr:peptidylprolyl isomerase [Methanothermobacter wolfeii]MDI6702096.1 peptidylprolyl isomerase [Methanothermobacter wolfeii]
MAVNKGDFIKLEFTGKIKETGEVFDTTSEEVAKEAGLQIKKTFGPIPIVVGGGHLIKGLDEAVTGMEEGEEKHIEIEPEDAFGKRDPKLVQLIPMREFKKQGIKPYPGMVLTIEGHEGRVLNVSGGRVRVDFNHELAGKTLEYDVRVAEIITDDTEKVKSMIQLHYPSQNMDIDKTEVRIEDGTVTIYMDEMTKFDNRPYMDVTLARFRISRDIWQNMEGIKRVEFADVFEKKDEEVTEEEAEE